MLAFTLFEHWTSDDIGKAAAMCGFFLIVIAGVSLLAWKSKDLGHKRTIYCLYGAACFAIVAVIIYAGMDEAVQRDVEFHSRANEERAFAEQTFTQELFPDIEWHGSQINFTTGQCYVSVFVVGAETRVVVLDPVLDNTSHSQVLAGPPSESVHFVQSYCSQR